MATSGVWDLRGSQPNVELVVRQETSRGVADIGDRSSGIGRSQAVEAVQRVVRYEQIMAERREIVACVQKDLNAERPQQRLVGAVKAIDWLEALDSPFAEVAGVSEAQAAAVRTRVCSVLVEALNGADTEMVTTSADLATRVPRSNFRAEFFATALGRDRTAKFRGAAAVGLAQGLVFGGRLDLTGIAPHPTDRREIARLLAMTMADADVSSATRVLELVSSVGAAVPGSDFVYGLAKAYVARGSSRTGSEGRTIAYRVTIARFETADKSDWRSLKRAKPAQLLVGAS